MNESNNIRDQLNRALEGNDIRTICYIAMEYLTEELSREDALFIINHEVNILEKVFTGISTIRELGYLSENFSYFFDSLVRFAPDIVRKRVIKAYFKIRPLYNKSENFLYHFKEWFLDYFLEEYKDTFSKALKEVLIEFLIQKNKEEVRIFVQDFLIEKINREDFIEILKQPNLNYFEKIKDFQDLWYEEEGYHVIPPALFENSPPVMKNLITELIENYEKKTFINLINSRLIHLVDFKKLLNSSKINIFFVVSQFYTDKELYKVLGDTIWEWGNKFFKTCKKIAPDAFLQRFSDFLETCSAEELLRILKETHPFPIRNEELSRIINSSESDYLEKFVLAISLIEDYYEDPLHYFDWLLDWFYQKFQFLKNITRLDKKVIKLSTRFPREVLLTRWLEFLDDVNFITLVNDTGILNNIYEILDYFSIEEDLLIIAKISCLLNRFLHLKKEECRSFIERLEKYNYTEFMEALKSLLMESTKEYQDLIIDKKIKESCACLLSFFEDYNILDKFQSVKYEGEFFLVIDNVLRIKNRNIENITNIEGLQTPGELITLDLSSNKIKKLKGLRFLTNLENLNLSRNKIKDVNELKYLKNLRNLNLSSNNELSDFTGLENLDNLKKIDVFRTILPIRLRTKRTAREFLRVCHKILTEKKFLAMEKIYNEAKSLSDDNKNKEAKALLLKVIEGYPEYYDAWNDLGYELIVLKQYEEAESWLKKILESDDCVHFHSNAYYNYACLHSLRNEHQKAIKTLKKAIDLNEDIRQSLKDELDFNNIKNFPEFKNILLGFDANKNEPFPPSSFSILTSRHSKLRNTLNKGAGVLKKKKSGKKNLELPKTDQLQLLEELENLLKRKLPYVHRIDYGTSGVKVEDGNITGLGLIACGVSEVPEIITKFAFLTKLVIRDSNLSLVPGSIGDLKSLKSLSLCGYTRISKLVSLPEAITDLKELKSLTLEDNRLKTLPTSIGKFRLLEKLNLWNNYLEALPLSIGDLSKLKNLQLALNKELKTLPTTFANLGSLEILSLHQNSLSIFPEVITNLENLQELDLSMNSISTFPDSLENLLTLKYLNLSSNSLDELPEVITKLIGLERLDLNVNNLKVISPTIGNLINLRSLNLSYNRDLRTLPDTMANIKNLESLELEECYDIILPKSLETLKNLEVYGNSDLEYDTEGNFELNLSISWGCPSVASYEIEDMRNELRNPNEIIIEDETIKIEFTYPLSVRVEFEYNKKGGFSRMDLWRCIYEGYKKIYDAEEADAGDPGNAPNLLNRGRSDGRYGVWGHSIGELYIEQINYNTRTKRISMFIGS